MRKSHFVWVGIALLLAGSKVSADVCFSPLRDNNPVVRVENLESYPNYDFYLSYGHSTGNPASKKFITPVRGNGTTRIEGDGWRFTSVYLIAVPKGQALPRALDTARGFDDDRLGLLRSNPLEAFTVNGAPEGYIIPYQVHLSDGELKVTPLSLEIAPGEWLGSHLCTLAAGVAISVSVAWFGLVIFRRKQKRAT